MSEKFDEIWTILQSLAEQQKANDERLAKKFAEVAEQQRATDAQFKATDERLARKFAEVVEQQKELIEQQKELTEQQKELTEQQKELTEQQKATDAQLKATDAQLRKTDARLNRLAKQVGGMSNNDGTVTEEFFWNALKNRKELNGIVIEYSDKNVYRKKGNIADEFDILLWNGNSVILVETKYKVHPNDIKKLKEKKIPNFRRLFLDKTEQKVYVALAGFSIPDDIVNEAKESGFFVLRQSGENLLIEVDELKVY